MALILFDTNIFIDMLVGCHQAAVELAAYDEPAISMITYMELRSGEFTPPGQSKTRWGTQHFHGVPDRLGNHGTGNRHQG
ncbi:MULTISPECIES: hypothetical protein [unclassified Janthinobacterium]|uniref:hypothetical protein n=1 Tax=unclassified Janthinobacterium TaxID=2610881 RepID=UPI00160F74C1|nr:MULTISPECIES: hypothetical protein [unclassified Janthinobacterium]MBB5606231.1 putative nucleic acid-binding protein [Janthinobacterium sp. S3T4]MBB5611897.1 putative nucleic acid-binding protein [Janthinobacterium sp. S3M3]